LGGSRDQPRVASQPTLARNEIVDRLSAFRLRSNARRRRRRWQARNPKR
jgi:hypothetical protein